jgi:alkyl sulfatase BDS1-like metallo-beta-lactamase superfamily hydrolase
MDETTETFLELLLLGLYISFKLDDEFRQNIEDFTGSYRFRDQSRGVNVLLTFADGKMSWSERPKPEADVTITFKDGGALMRFLLAEKKDILQSILKNEVQVTGNLNYLYKIGFMANHLLLDYTGKLPQ